MPKMKTKSSAKKRFKVRAGGSIKRVRRSSVTSSTKKTTKCKRQLRGIEAVHDSDKARFAP